MGSHGSSFSGVSAYIRALAQTPRRFHRRACSVATSFDEMNPVRRRSDFPMQRSLRWYDLIGFGIGGMLGAGVFVTSGQASRLHAGPAVVLSYAIAGFAALLSAFCYTEFAVDLPVAGGAFSYLRVTFGEFAAFLAASNLVVDYVLGNAAVARSLSAYLATAAGVSSRTKWRITLSSIPQGYNEIDLVAVAVVLIITVVICYSTRRSSWLNMTLTMLHVIFIAFVIAIGFSRGEWNNFTHAADPGNESGFFPYGIAGVFDGAAIVYMSYIGYDAVSTMAEEVRYPVKDIPAGVSGSVIAVTTLYCLMAASMSKLLPYDKIDPEAPFSAAFGRRSDGWRWVSNVIGMGASFGILTSMLVAMIGQARYLCVIGRSGIIPEWFAKVHPTTSTPVNASAFLGICTAAIALFTDLGILLNLVTIGTLVVFYMVANAVIYRRYVTPATENPWPTLCFLFAYSISCISFTLAWHLLPYDHRKITMLGAFGTVAVGVLVLLRLVVVEVRKPEYWGVPLMPWVPSLSVFMNIFLLGSLDRPSYVRFGVFSAIAVAFYLLYSVHASFDAVESGALDTKNAEIPEIKELSAHGDGANITV